MTPLDRVCNAFIEIASVRSRLAKRETLAAITAHVECDKIAKELLSIAFDESRIFHIGKLPEPLGGPAKPADDFFTIAKILESKSSVSFMEKQYMADCIAAYPHENTRKILAACITKSLSIGMGEVAINHEWPGLIKIFRLQLADLLQDLDRIPYGYPVIVEPKVDGVRAVILVENGTTKIFSRGGKPLYHTNLITDDLVKIHNEEFGEDAAIVYDGEFFSGSFNDTMKVVRSYENDPDLALVENMKFYGFDILSKAEWESRKSKSIQWDRSHLLPFANHNSERVRPIRFKDQDLPVLLAHNQREVLTYAKVAADQGFEGIMIKNVYGTYEFDRTPSWLKFKPVVSETFRVVGWYQGNGRLENTLGGIEIAVAPGVTCKVGSGFTDEMRNELMLSSAPIEGRLVEIEYKVRTPDGKLREPIFKGFRN